MSIVLRLECDDCGERYGEAAYALAPLRRAATADGWHLAANRHRCPACADDAKASA